jgi:protein SCO1/2
MQGQNFSALQTKLGARMGKDVFLILVTRDPQVDTPQKLKEWGIKYGVKPGWTLLTGDTKEVARLIGIFTGDKPGPVEAHSTGIYIGNDAKGAWIYANGLSNPDLLIKSIDQLLQ